MAKNCQFSATKTQLKLVILCKKTKLKFLILRNQIAIKLVFCAAKMVLKIADFVQQKINQNLWICATKMAVKLLLLCSKNWTNMGEFEHQNLQIIKSMQQKFHYCWNNETKMELKIAKILI